MDTAKVWFIGFGLFLLLAPETTAAQGAPVTPLQRRIGYHGRVVDSAGLPVRGAGLAVLPRELITTLDALKRPLTRSDADGRFVLEKAVAPEESEETFGFIVAHPGKAAWYWWSGASSAYMPGTAEGDASFDLGDVRLEEGIDLRGRVRGRDGKGLAGASVMAMDLLPRSTAMTQQHFASRALTAQDGSFVLPCALAQGLELIVEAEGHYRRTLSPVSAATPLLVELQPSGFVEGRVLDEQDRPVTARVVIESESDKWEWRFDRTGDDGVFRLSVRSPGRFRVSARRPGSNHEGVKSEVLRGPTKGVVLRLTGPSWQAVDLRASDAKTGAAVKAFWGKAFWNWRDHDLVFLDASFAYDAVPANTDGLARLAGPETGNGEDAVIRVVADGYAPALVEGVRWPQEERVVVAAKLSAECVIEGRVLEEETGKPIPGARVTCLPDRLDGAPLHSLMDHTGKRFGGRSARSLADGSFRIGTIGKGVYAVSASHPQRLDTSSQLVNIEEDGGNRRLDLRMSAGVTVSVRLTGERPDPGWKLRLEKELPRQGAWMHVPVEEDFRIGVGALAGEDGAFRFAGRSPGNGLLVLQVPIAPRCGPSLRILLEELVVQGPAVHSEVNVSANLPGTLAGRVSFTGAELSMDRIVVAAREVPEPRAVRMFRPQGLGRLGQRVFLAPDGSFAMPLIAGRYWLSVVDVATGVVLAWHPEEVEIAASRRTEVALAAEVVAVRAILSPEGDGPWYAIRLKLEPETELDEKQVRTQSSPPWISGPGLDLGEHPEEVSFYVGPGDVKLTVHSNAWRLLRGTPWPNPLPLLAEVAFKAVPGKVNVVDVKVSAPPVVEAAAKGKAKR